MPIIQNPMVLKKNQRATFFVSKTELLNHPKVLADSYFSDSANWKNVVLRYETDDAAPQVENIQMDASMTSPTGQFFVSDKARDDFKLKAIIITDFDGDAFPIYIEDLSEEVVDLIFTPDVLAPIINSVDYAGAQATISVSNENSGEAFLKIFRKTEDEEDFTVIFSGMLQSGVWTINDPLYQEVTDRTYSYKATLTIDGAESLDSNISEVIVPAFEAPGQVTNMALSVNDINEITLMGDYVNGATSYKVYRSIDDTNFVLIAQNLPDPYFNQTISENVTYFYKMTSDNGLESEPSESVTIRAVATPELSLEHEGDPLHLIAYWNDAQDGITTYWIEWGDDGDFPFNQQNISMPFSFENLLDSSKTYNFRLMATNNVGNGSTKGSLIVVAATYPAAPENFNAQMQFEGNGVVLTWEETLCTTYDIYRGATSETMTYLEQDIPHGGQTTFNDTTAVAGSTYFYGIQSRYEGMDSGFSNIKQIKVIGMPESPTVESDGAEGMIITWPEVAGADKYRVTVMDDNGIITPVSVDNAESPLTVPALGEGSFTIQVYCSNEVGDGSEVVSGPASFQIESAELFGFSMRYGQPRIFAFKAGETITKPQLSDVNNSYSTFTNLYASVAEGGKKYFEFKTLAAPTLSGALGTLAAINNLRMGSGFDGEILDAHHNTSDDSIVMVGTFTKDGSGQDAPRVVCYFATNGARNKFFMNGLGTGFNGAVTACSITLQGGAKKYYFAGDFTEFNGTPVGRIVRLNSNGTLDTGFTCPAITGGTIKSIATRQNPSTEVFFGGSFTQIGGEARPYFGALDYSGGFLATFPIANVPNGPVNVVRINQAGSILFIGGNFTLWNSSPAGYYREITISSGAVVATFSTNFGAGLNAQVTDLSVSNSTQVLAVGDFTNLKGVTYNRYILMNQGNAVTAYYSNGVNGNNGFATRPTGCVHDGANGMSIVFGDFATHLGVSVGKAACMFLSNGAINTDYQNQIGTGFDVAPKVGRVLQSMGIAIAGDFNTLNGATYKKYAQIGYRQTNLASATVSQVGFIATDVEPSVMINPVAGSYALKQGNTGDPVFGLDQYGGFYIDNVIHPQLCMQPPSANTVIGMALDLTAKKMWVSRDGGWINGNPQTGVGGLDISAYLTKDRIFVGASYFSSAATNWSLSLNRTLAYPLANFGLPSKKPAAPVFVLQRTFEVDGLQPNEVLTGAFANMSNGALELLPDNGTGTSRYDKTGILVPTKIYAVRIHIKTIAGVGTATGAVTVQGGTTSFWDDRATMDQTTLNTFVLGFIELSIRAKVDMFSIINAYGSGSNDFIRITKIEIYEAKQ